MNDFVSAPAAEIPALSMEALVKKVSGTITNFMEIQDVKEYCEVVQSEVPQSSHSDFIKCCIDYAIDKNIEVCKETGRLVYELVKTGVIGLDSFKSGSVPSKSFSLLLFFFAYCFSIELHRAPLGNPKMGIKN